MRKQRWAAGNRVNKGIHLGEGHGGVLVSRPAFQDPVSAGGPAQGRLGVLSYTSGMKRVFAAAPLLALALACERSESTSATLMKSSVKSSAASTGAGTSTTGASATGSPTKQVEGVDPPVDPPAPRKIVTPGEWAETLRYRVRVLSVAPCESPEQATDKDTPAAVKTAAGRLARKFRLGVAIEVEALEPGVSPVLSSPKAARLEKDGKIFPALMRVETTPACDGLLGVKDLTKGETAKGLLVFEAPDESYLRSALLAFKPPRWGGDERAEIRLPSCFEPDCEKQQ